MSEKYGKSYLSLDYIDWGVFNKNIQEWTNTYNITLNSISKDNLLKDEPMTKFVWEEKKDKTVKFKDLEVNSHFEIEGSSLVYRKIRNSFTEETLALYECTGLTYKMSGNDGVIPVNYEVTFKEMSNA